MRERRFVCDDMLRGLARWLRAAGYDTACQPDIEDRSLIARALEEGRLLLTCDTRIAERNVARRGPLRLLLVPRGLGNVEALTHVLRRLRLPLRPARCMLCNGSLSAVSPQAAAARVPPRSRAAFRRFLECRRCGKAYWYGSHWRRIHTALRHAAREAGVDDSALDSQQPEKEE